MPGKQIYGNLWEKNLGTKKSKNRREKIWEIYGTLGRKNGKWEQKYGINND